MDMKNRVICVALMAIWFVSVGEAQRDQVAYRNSSLPVDQRVADLLKRMTLEEKVAQLQSFFQFPAEMLPAGPMFPGLIAKGSVNQELLAQVAKDGLGTISFYGVNVAPKDATALRNVIQRFAVEKTRLGVPILFHGEALHGAATLGSTSFPQAIALASTWDPALVERIFTVVAKEVRRQQIHQVLSPVLDLGREPRYGRIEETYGEDPHLAAQMGLAAVKGLQGPGPGLDGDHVIATAKHFIHGQPEGGTNVAPSDNSERVLRQVFLHPFQVAVTEGGIGSVMPSYNTIDGIPSSANPWLLKKVLRGEWEFAGTVVSDYMAVQQLLSLHHVVVSPAEAAQLALQSGIDMELPMPFAYPTLVESVRAGRVPQSEVDGSVARVLRMKFLAGIFDQPYEDPENAARVVGSEAHGQLARQAADEAIVLLKNEGNLLPLNPVGIRTLAVIGPNADKKRLGTYSGEPPYFVTVLDGIRKRLGDKVQVVYAEGCRITDPDNNDPVRNFMQPESRPDPAGEEKRIAEALVVAQKADTVVLVLGGNEVVSRESIGRMIPGVPAILGDTDTLQLPGFQDELAAKILKLGKPVAVVLLNGRPYSIERLAATVPAIVEGWYLGQETGSAVAGVLFGDVNPAGRLPVTIARNVGQLPVYYFQTAAAKRGYVFSDDSPLYPFGFGLSYTTFRYGQPTVVPEKIEPTGQAVVAVDVTNTGTREGDEVVQMYVHHAVSSVVQPLKLLKAFRRIQLKPGETQTVRFVNGVGPTQKQTVQ